MFDIAADTREHRQVGTVRILVVEAEPRVAIMLEDALNDFGYHVLGPAENLKAATSLAATEHIDAAVVDTNIDGEIAEAVADTLLARGIPFVFVSDHVRMFNLNYSKVPLLQHPFTIDELHHTITRLMQGGA